MLDFYQAFGSDGAGVRGGEGRARQLLRALGWSPDAPPRDGARYVGPDA